MVAGFESCWFEAISSTSRSPPIEFTPTSRKIGPSLHQDTFNSKSSYDHKYEEFTNPWAFSPAELEQDQAFIKYLEELDKPISEHELTEWSNDIDLFMEGLSNTDKLETLWEQSKAKKSYGMIHKTSHQLNWISTYPNLIL